MGRDKAGRANPVHETGPVPDTVSQQRRKAGEEHMEWNEPMYVEASGTWGRVGVLLIHGFGGSPRSLQELALRLVDAGYSVALPLLTGHGLTPEAMEASRWTDWTADVERAFEWLEERTDALFLCGLSMGGTLALWLAARHPEVAGLVTINALIRHPRERAIPLLCWLGHPRWAKAVGNDAKCEGVDEKAYARLPVRSAKELALLSRDVRSKLGSVKCPVLVFSSSVDHIVPPANQRELYESIASADKTLVELHDSYHLATMDNDKEFVFARTLDFIAERVRAATAPAAAGLDV
jgi:carboxylesterase